MKQYFRTAIAVVSAACIGLPMAAAQTDTRGIGAMGTATKTARPEFVRMKMTITSKGSDTLAAIESIKARKKAAAVKLEKLDVIEDSIVFGRVVTGEQSGGGGPNAQQMRRMMMQNFGDGQAAKKLMAVQPPVTVSVSVTADWAMPTGEEEELLTALEALKASITEADVAGTKSPDELTPEQEELAAEFEVNMRSYSSGNEAEPGTPIFMYGRRFAQSDADELMKQAYENAKMKASQLAEAASTKMGSLMSLVSRDNMPDYSDYDMYDYYRQSSFGRAGRQMMSKEEAGIVMVIGTNPAEVTFESNVYAAFAFDP